MGSGTKQSSVDIQYRHKNDRLAQKKNRSSYKKSKNRIKIFWWLLTKDPSWKNNQNVWICKISHQKHCSFFRHVQNLGLWFLSKRKSNLWRYGHYHISKRRNILRETAVRHCSSTWKYRVFNWSPDYSQTFRQSVFDFLHGSVSVWRTHSSQNRY